MITIACCRIAVVRGEGYVRCGAKWGKFQQTAHMIQKTRHRDVYVPVHVHVATRPNGRPSSSQRHET